MTWRKMHLKSSYPKPKALRFIVSDIHNFLVRLLNTSVNSKPRRSHFYENHKFVSHLALLKTSISVILKLNFPSNEMLHRRGTSSSRRKKKAEKTFSDETEKNCLYLGGNCQQTLLSILAEAKGILKSFSPFSRTKYLATNLFGFLFAVVFCLSSCLISPLKVSPHSLLIQFRKIKTARARICCWKRDEKRQNARKMSLTNCVLLCFCCCDWCGSEGWRGKNFCRI